MDTLPKYTDNGSYTIDFVVMQQRTWTSLGLPVHSRMRRPASASEEAFALQGTRRAGALLRFLANLGRNVAYWAG